MSSNRIIDSVIKAALIENSEQKKSMNRSHNLDEPNRTGTKWKKTTTSKLSQKPILAGFIISLDEKPVSFNNLLNINDNVRNTYGVYTIKYIPKTDRRRIKDKPFVIYQDLIRFRPTVADYKHWAMLCRRIPELNWLYRNSTLTPRLFGLAHRHPGMGFIFTIDWDRYCEKIETAAKEQGIDINNQPFVTYQCDSKRAEEINSMFHTIEFDPEYYRDISARADLEYFSTRDNNKDDIEENYDD